jgi:GSH-dependent disulfide-bond oxidoreductase
VPAWKLELFTFGSTNGHKVAIALEELCFVYDLHTVNVFAGEGRTSEFLALNPAGKLRDLEADLVLTESDAILLYLADKAGRLVPAAGRERTRAIELLFLQSIFAGTDVRAKDALLRVFSRDDPLRHPALRREKARPSTIWSISCCPDRDYFLGAEFSIVDIAFYAWYFASRTAGFETEHHANLQSWFERVSAQPAVARGVTIPGPLPALPPRKRA